MQVKRFFAADMRQAMKLVRDELGADAAIIGNRRIAGGVELTAALDYKLSALAPRVPNMELEDELRKTQSRIVTAQAELSLRSDGEFKSGLYPIGKTAPSRRGSNTQSRGKAGLTTWLICRCLSGR